MVRIRFILIALSIVAPATLDAQASRPPTQQEIARRVAVGQVRARLGQSGLRRFLAESSSLGELENRAASYRMIERLERARRAELEGRIAGLGAALEDPQLPASERRRLESARSEAQATLATRPAYQASYRTATGQVGGLTEIAFLGGTPLFLLGKMRGAWRADAGDELRVFAGRVDLAPAIVLGERVLCSAGMSFGRSDIDIPPFQGISNATATGFRADVGLMLSDHWTVAVHGQHTWSRSHTLVVPPEPEGRVAIESRPGTATTAAKAELFGRYDRSSLSVLPAFLVLHPRAGAYAMRTTHEPTTDSQGETATGVFGDTDALTLLTAGLAFETAGLGPWAPSLYVGYEHELPTAMAQAVQERHGITVSGSLFYLLGRLHRVGLSFTTERGLRNRRRSTEIAVIGLFDL